MALAAGCAAHHPVDTGGPAAPFFEGLGTWRRPVTTTSREAQKYFDQGLILAYGFNHAEAERSFREAAKLDPECAMCWWGAALVVGPNINAAMEPAAAPRAWEAITRAKKAKGASPLERGLIDALSKRYAKKPPENRSGLDKAYADAMRQVALAHPGDPDVRTLFAESMLDMRPWDQWQPDGTPQPGTLELVGQLEAVLKMAPEHPGAMHYYIHATEGSKTPERALDAAERLGDVVPGAGHLVHMPAHTWFRLGRYHDAAEANRKAEQVDSRYISQCHAQGVYPLAYVPHNPHFGWAAAAMAGEKSAALAFADATLRHTDTSMLREPGLESLQHYSLIPLWARTRFGMWDDILAAPAPPEDLRYPAGIRHYARGLALARTGRAGEARAELDALRAIAADAGLERITIWNINSAQAVLAIAVQALTGEIAATEGRIDDAVEALTEGVRLEDGLRYNEPPDWHYPVRQTLGAVLLQAGRAEEAEAVYRADLQVFPENGWALFGLAKSVEVEGKASEAADARERFASAWAHADIEISASRF